MDEKQKRLRTHVVKEIVETEKVYCDQISFVTQTLLPKMREKARHDKSFTEEVIGKLFCNMEDLHALHQRLLQDIEVIGRNPTHLSTVARTYVKHVEGFEVYTEYGGNHENAQKLVFELEKDPLIKGFFTGCMLLGGHGDATVDAYLFKPVQRITKYPLLFRELLRYTPPEHPDYDCTKEMVSAMKTVCSYVNETKRRVEKLEAIADWQSTVEGWEGPNVTDSSSDLIKKGTLIKISAGNTQEREFFLFDNLLVYCKKTNTLTLNRRGKEKAAAAAAQNKPGTMRSGTMMGTSPHQLQFKGRVPMESLEVEDIEDGRSDYHTNGITVTNGWKVRNIVKNKWFVLIAKTSQEKKEWMEAIRGLKDRKRRLAAGIAQDTHGLLMDKGQALYRMMKKEENPIIKDRKYHLRTFQKCFSGNDLVTWLMGHGEAAKVEEAVYLGQALLENGIIHHVTDDHQFKNEHLFYRFRYDDGTFRHKQDLQDVHVRGLRVYLRLQGMYTPKIKEHKQAFASLKNVVSGSKLVDWMLEIGDVTTRAEGVLLGQDMFGQGIIRHISDEQKFKDSSSLYYRFTADDGLDEPSGKGKSPSSPQKQDIIKRLRELAVRKVDVPWCKEGFGLTLTQGRMSTVIGTVEEESAAQLVGVVPRQSVVALGNHYVPVMGLPDAKLQEVVQMYNDLQSPLPLTVMQTPQLYVTIKPNEAGSLGVHIRGSYPAVVSRVDANSPASKVGVVSGSCIMSVNEKDVTQICHDDVVDVVRQSAKGKAGAGVTFKLGVGGVQYMSQYSFESTEGPKDLYTTLDEAPLTFTLPAQFLQVQSNYYQVVAELLRPLLGMLKLPDIKVTLQTYVDQLDKLHLQYDQAGVSLSTYSSSHWPTFKPYGSGTSPLLRPCPTNCHLHKLVISSTPTPSQPTSPAPIGASADEEPHSSLPALFGEIEGVYPYVTMALPSKAEFNLSLSLKKVELIYGLRRAEAVARQRYQELCSERKIVEQFNRRSSVISQASMDESIDLSQDDTPNGVGSGGSQDDDDPSVGLIRRRLASITDMSPVLKLIKEGIQSKVNAFIAACDNHVVEQAFLDTKHIVHDEFCDAVTSLRRAAHKELAHVDELTKVFSEQLGPAVDQLAKSLYSYMQMFAFRLHLAVALLEDPSFLEAQDTAFSQLLSATMSGFMEQLGLALGGEYNPAAQHMNCIAGSDQWLAQLAHIGVLVAVEAPMKGVKGDDTANLEVLRKTLKLLQNVSICMEPLPPDQAEEIQHPVVSLRGNRSMLTVVVSLPERLFQDLPEKLVAVKHFRLIPVLFTHSLSKDNPEYDLAVLQRSINEKSLQTMKEYYRHMRMYRLSKEQLPEDPEAQQAAIHQISQPLSSLEVLVAQLQKCVDHIYDGVGLLSLASEAATRMGGVRITACDSGVVRSMMSLTLEQTALLARCHALPQKGLRTVMNKFREGKLVILERKNVVNVSTAFSSEPPRLYRVPERADRDDDDAGT